MTSEQRKVKFGDVLQVRSQLRTLHDFHVCAVSADGVFGDWRTAEDRTDGARSMLFAAWSAVVLPAPPKAKPGVRYRYAGTRLGEGDGFGLADGRIFDRHKDKIREFYPDHWSEIAEHVAEASR